MSQRGCCTRLFSPFDNSTLIINHDVIMNIDEIIVRHSTLTNGTAGLLISLITCSETAVPIRIGSISLYFPDRMFGEDRSRLTVGCETKRNVVWISCNWLFCFLWPKEEIDMHFKLFKSFWLLIPTYLEGGWTLTPCNMPSADLMCPP